LKAKKPLRMDALGLGLALIGIAFIAYGVYRAVQNTTDAIPFFIAGIAFLCVGILRITPR